ncbi:MAG: hypothetical protein AAFZ18_03565 [Myxococcota bacterium]
MGERRTIWVLKSWDGQRGVYKAEVYEWNGRGLPVVWHPSGFTESLRRNDFALTRREATIKVEAKRHRKAHSLRSRLEEIETAEVHIPE